MSLSLPAAELAANFIACVLYGIYLVTLGLAARVFLTTESGRMRHRAEINWIVVGVSVMLFVFGTLDLILAMTLSVQAFVLYTGPGGAEHIFAHASSWKNFTKSTCTLLQSLTGDSILIYRCWYLHHKSWLIITVPAIIWLANVVCGIGILVLQSRLNEGQVNSGNIVSWGLGFYTFTICTNIVATSLIVRCIWRVEKETKTFRFRDSAHNQPQSNLARAMRNIVESGMIYTFAYILQLAAFSSGSTLNYPASALALHSVGITFNLILIRGTSRPKEDSLVSATSIRFSRTASNSNNAPSTTGAEPDDKPEVFVLSRLQKNADSVCGGTT
ncbi:hypothetical protein B0H11DRAFT_1755200 [Mycena galericulata]|nr:hypothetical protein B0H11DRAFT_1755200 [Mycena galericulata]